MIEKVIVKNFRNLEYYEFDITSKTTIIKGDNKLGKSNLLNAIHLFITGYLLTDNYGKGETDIDSIVPTGQSKGDDHTEITLVVNGQVFTKIFKVAYETKTHRRNGHSWEHRINGTKFSKSAFDEKFDAEVKFTPTLKVVNEKRFLTDPLYLLFKLANEANGTTKLRNFLEENLNCSVTNDEVFELNSELECIKHYEKQYLGDFELAYKELTKKADGIDAQCNVIIKGLPTLDKCVIHSAVKDDLLMDLAKALDKKERVSKPDNKRVQELNLELKSWELERKAREQEFNESKEIDIKLLQDKKLGIIKANAEARNKAYSKIDEQIKTLEVELNNYEYQKKYAQSMMGNVENSIKYFENEVISLTEKRKNLADQYNEVANSKPSDFITCPHCAGLIVDPKFEEKKKSELSRISTEGKLVKTSLDTAKRNLEENQDKLNTMESDVIKFTSSINETKKLITELRQKRNSIGVEDITEQIAVIDEELRTLGAKQCDFTDIDSKIKEINDQMSLIEGNTSIEADAMIKAIEEEIIQIKAKIEAESELEDNFKKRKQGLEEIKKLEQQINDINFDKGKIFKFIQCKIEILNSKVSNKTGVEFVMLEPNLGDGTLKKTCYAVVDGVEFANLNTADKYKVGIRIIENVRKAKNISNDLPILMDRLEAIGQESSLYDLTSLPMVCTRVGTNKNIEILRG